MIIPFTLRGLRTYNFFQFHSPLNVAIDMTGSGLIRYQNVSEIKIKGSRNFRKGMTEAEYLLWERLRNRKHKNLKFRRQQIIYGFIADFYCEELKLCIEVDGEIHKTIDATYYDMVRNEIFTMHGLHTIRIANDEIKNDIKSVLAKIG